MQNIRGEKSYFKLKNGGMNGLRDGGEKETGTGMSKTTASDW